MAAVGSRERRGPSLERGERPRRLGSLEARQIRPKGPTLEERLTGTWTRLVADGSSECLVCGSSLRAAFPCESCGSDLT